MKREPFRGLAYYHDRALFWDDVMTLVWIGAVLLFAFGFVLLGRACGFIAP